MARKSYLITFLLLLLITTIQYPQSAHAETKWKARYWNNLDLSGDPVVRRDESNLDHDWGDEAPHELIDKDHFSARWTRDVEFSAGLYRLVATTDDGMRVYVDGNLVIDSWYDSQVHAVSADVYLSGWHNIKVEYYEAGGGAIAKLVWIAQPSEPAVINNWRGEYYNNTTLFYPPARVSDDTAVNFDWGYDAPFDGITSANHFSARWTRTLPFTAGTYQFTLSADDGVRLWVNDQLVVDAWYDQTETTHTVNVALPAGNIPIKLEYYENGGKAYVNLDWQATAAAPSAPITTSETATSPETADPVESTLSTTQAKMVNAIHLTVRSEPSLDGEPLGYLSRNQIVNITGFRYGGWVQLTLPTGEVGWAGGSYLELGRPFVDLAVWQGTVSE